MRRTQQGDKISFQEEHQQTCLESQSHRCRHHLLRLEDLPVALGAAVLIALLGLDDPSLHGGPGHEVVLLAVKLGDRTNPAQ